MERSVCYWARKSWTLTLLCASMCMCLCVFMCTCLHVFLYVCVRVCACVCLLTVPMQHFQRPLLVWTTPCSCSYPSLTPHSFLHPGEREWKKRGGGWGGSGNNRLLSPEGLWKKEQGVRKRRERNIGEKMCLLCVLALIEGSWHV